MLGYIESFRAGEAGYYREHARATVDVWHDSRRYVYRRPSDLKEFKCELAEAFSGRLRPPCRVVGAYPSYTIEERY